MERKTERPDFMAYIMRFNDERGMSVPEIDATANAMVIAGSGKYYAPFLLLLYFLEARALDT